MAAPPGHLDTIEWAYASGCRRALGFAFAFRTTVAPLGAYLETLLAAFPVDGERPAAVYSLLDRGRGAPRRWIGYVDDQRVAFTDRASLALAYLLWHLNREVVEHSSDLLLLHAAGAVEGGGGVVLPGPMEAGKTTTVAGLVRAGMRYLSDEIVAVDPRTLTLQPYPKALTVDAGSWGVLADLQPRLEDDLVDFVAEQWHVPPGSLRADAVAAPCPPRIIVAPRFRAGAASRLEPVARAEMLALLASSTFAFRARPRRNLQTLAELVMACDCYRLTVGDLDTACVLVSEALDEAMKR
ncbi:MAG: hypothetical protein M3N52_07735 [Actinomycetota bacterium]|nr:hypothetical protein [Actinomycetota bacterium]